MVSLPFFSLCRYKIKNKRITHRYNIMGGNNSKASAAPQQHAPQEFMHGIPPGMLSKDLLALSLDDLQSYRGECRKLVDNLRCAEKTLNDNSGESFGLSALCDDDSIHFIEGGICHDNLENQACRQHFTNLINESDECVWAASIPDRSFVNTLATQAKSTKEAKAKQLTASRR